MTKNNRLPLEFYKQSAVSLAPLLLGKVLCRKIGDEIIRLKITETEAYAGEQDTACHAHKGKTARTSVMYEKGGVTYIYLCYGIHYLLNVVAADEDEPEAVLIRGLEGISGPGRLTKALQIDKTLNKVSLINSNELWLEDGAQLSYTTTPRIGINYASEEYRIKQWRFVAE
ncbi:MAG: DNA-3-methyladenine glycosylase [Defluviitaleaceae bacterium]|nr:DNA-3-methyladenine glycosylase [Defluviitaleaceae bacterium]